MTLGVSDILKHWHDSVQDLQKRSSTPGSRNFWLLQCSDLSLSMTPAPHLVTPSLLTLATHTVDPS